ncbi:hypothetical protein ABEB36_012462 [Hypothenemus hampei]|uniref:non-specific serine/threonine protein kinase n=1 Tax=Hypothenemus hampei TaxID=57062 RepID=A0ABD1EBA7_HYPHA
MPLNELRKSSENYLLAHDPFLGDVKKSTSVEPHSGQDSQGIGGVSLTARYLIYKHLLSLVNVQDFPQIEPTNFEKCYPKSLTQHCHKIGEGLYGEVFLYRRPIGGTTVMKVIPIGGTQTVNGENQKKWKEVLSEIIIATELSNLKYSRTDNQTSGFVEVTNIQCVQGKYPEALLNLWDLYKETKGSINESPEIFEDDQLYLVLETNYAGCPVASFPFIHAAQAFSMFLQIAFALAIAEDELQFEHRDLHLGNILLTQVSTNEKITYRFRGKEIKICSYGVKVTMIDFTMSRITLDNVNIFVDLSNDCGVFNGSGDYQYEIYKLMQQKNGNEWSHFEPYSNVLWLSYILDKTVTTLRYEDTNCKLHRKYMNKLKELNLEMLGHDSARDFVCNLFGNKIF